MSTVSFPSALSLRAYEKIVSTPPGQSPAPAPNPALVPPPDDRSFLGKAKDAVLDGVRDTTNSIEDHPLVKATVISSLDLMKVLHAFPKFIYPTITGATAAEHSFILQTLDSIPLKDVNTIKSLVVVPNIPDASGLAIPYHVTNVIHLARDQISLGNDWFREVVIHEAGHTKDFDSSWFGLFHFNSGHGPWGHAPFITDYARTNHWEDYADTHAKFFTDPQHLQQVAPEKYNLMAQQEHQNFLEQAIDNKAFRETGKWIGEHVFPNQTVRTGVEVLYWAAGGLQVLTGLEKIRQSYEQNDPGKHAEGILDVTSGTLYATKLLGLAGLAVQGARRALQDGLKHQTLTGDDADAAIRKLSDPVEKAIRWGGSKAGIMEPFKEFPASPSGALPRIGLATGIAAGGAAGALVGGIAGPYAGVMGGYALAGPIGGAAGLVVGAVAGYMGGAILGGRLGGAVAKGLGA